MKKYSNDPIQSIVDLGDGKYEFCWNFDQEQMEDHVSYSSDVLTIEGVPNKQAIIEALIDDEKTEIEADNLVSELNI